MKSVDQIIGYIEGRISVMKGFEPERVEVYALQDILNYIKEDENDN